jgi:hypothetical protein
MPNAPKFPAAKQECQSQSESTKPLTEQSRSASAGIPQADVEKFITLREAGEALGIPYYKIRKAAKLRLFPVYHFGNSRMLVRLSEVIAAIERSRVGGEQ